MDFLLLFGGGVCDAGQVNTHLEAAMQTSRFQLGLITTLAVGLGFSLSSSDAVGYPAGAAVSLGANPVSSAGGSIASGGSIALMSADSSGPFLVTDVVLTRAHCDSHTISSTVQLQLVTGEVLAEFRLASDSDGGGGDDGTEAAMVRHAYSSGIVIPAGTTAEIHHSGCGTVGYSVSGYQAQG